jgi:hypothetical protein
MRKFFITFTVIALIISIVGTGIIVYIDMNTPMTESTTISGE